MKIRCKPFHLFAIISIAALFPVFSSYFGVYTIFFLVSGNSMLPTLHSGDIILTLPAMGEIANGTIVVFKSPSGEFMSHRIVDTITTEEGIFYKTIGDNNAKEDSFLVPRENIVGVFLFAVPKMGLYFLMLREIAVVTVLSLLGSRIGSHLLSMFWNFRKSPSPHISHPSLTKSKIRKRGILIACIFITILLSSSFIFHSEASTKLIYPIAGKTIAPTTPKVVLQQGSTGTSAIYDNGVNANVSVGAPIQGAAFIGYRSNTGANLLNSPKQRSWNGSAWSSEGEMPTAGSSVRFVRVAYCPLSSRYYEKIVVTLSDDGYLDAYVWNGTAWNATTNIGYVGTTANAYRPFDIAYEHTSGKAVLVYGISSIYSYMDLAYRTWTYGTGWSTEYYIDDIGHFGDIQYYWIALASNPTSGSNEITLVGIDATNSDGNGWVWDGTSWGSMYELDGTVSITTEECIAVAYESQSGRAWTAVGSDSTPNTFSIRSQTGGTWNTTKENPNVGAVPNWCTLKPDPASNKLMLTSVDGNSDLNTVYYSGSGAWTVQSQHDGSVDTNSRRCADFAWEPTGSKGLLVWGTTSGKISYRNFTAPSSWSSAFTINAAGTHLWIQLRQNTGSPSIKILGAMLNSNNDLGALKWDGTTVTNIGDAAFTADTTVTTYECFEIEFQQAAAMKYDYVLKILNQVADPFRVRLKAYTQSNIERLQNCTIYFYNGGISRQIYINNGVYEQQIGSWFDLAASGTDYIAIDVSANSGGTSRIYTYLEIQIQNYGITMMYTVNFEIT